ncbi:hypothetical protein N7462_003730 [Penicillium macrosclerotiorum]|uniref:uncharacterized protein n=1 Tax=Penicillium macrosclerotiorum TaxID=303699 RepID=UPI002547E1C7|nr:uncharacterized protein N7462_003730 [Penicillium macrosclerotiorum]KAJ5689338.1 hypothetical protein N7462_003730 [Penicillium macrosclerotiorum]
MSTVSVVLPRPGGPNADDTQEPIRGPSEASFVAKFGSLLPLASFLATPNGRVAYYELKPSPPVPTDQINPISRVLLVHGVQTSAIGLQPLASALSSRFAYTHFVLVDLWGHGLTDTPLKVHNSVLFHGLLEAVTANLKWENAHFLGYSFGGSTAASFAAVHAERVASMVLVAPAGLMRAASFNNLQRSYLHGGEGIEEQAQTWILEFLEGGQLIVPSDWKEKVKRGEVVAEAVRDWQMKEHKGHLASIVGIFQRRGANGYPKLVCLGELDDVVSEQDLNEVGMQNVVVLPQVGHGVVRDRVPEVTQLVEDFWNKLLW